MVVEKKNNNLSTLASSIAGLIGNSIGKFVCHPIDTIKAKIQVQQTTTSSRFGFVIKDVAMKTLAKEGWPGLYRGFGISLIGSVPASGLYFGSYEFFKQKTLKIKYLQERPFLTYLAGGMFAETVACIIFVPIDVIKERRQVQSDLKTFTYKSDIDAIRQISKVEGLRGLYKAYGATVISFGPFSALYFMFYE